MKKNIPYTLEVITTNSILNLQDHYATARKIKNQMKFPTRAKRLC